jgi:hypothetical protein
MIVLFQVDHKFHIYDIADEFKTIMVETNHNFHMHYIANDFKIVLVEIYDKFHIYELNICRWKEITNSFNHSTFSNNNPFESEHEHHKKI